ncbi:MAG: 6-carboxytetrahydropterin synthase [Deltaproteobacteria bacterium]|nr:6-carboxytetrahydropterin synthase [Deltaproteobacteria bacterium]MBI3386339.1 6-carboxytetrahydropterin synthase [Deltaproteobacteria bacterium]
MKFSAAHFIAYPGFREALHGHNYRVSIDVEGQLGPNGYVVDFGVVKKIARRVCERLNERTLVPMLSDCLTISDDGPQVVMRYENDEFRLPRTDAALLPIVHSSAEELARYLAGELRRELATEGITEIVAIQVGVEETTGQAAYYREER